LNNNLLDDQEKINRPTFGEKLAFIAIVITTIGDILATVSSGILIEQGIEDAIEDLQEKKEKEQQLLKMQNQIDSLQREIQLMKKNTLKRR
jgi:prefoldin subunit 5